ncbi:outer membrane protein assembly factor BamE, partial [Acinetobacter baumannii]
SPKVTDPLNPQRWDYIYNYIPGTYARAAKNPVGRYIKGNRFKQSAQ